jgi:hypothetical protein
LTIEEIKAHPWYSDANVADLASIQEEFAERKARIDEEAEEKRRQKEAERSSRPVRPYRGAHRGEDDEEGEEGKYAVEEERKADEYIRMIHKNTEFFSTTDPAILLQVLNEYAHDTGITIDVAKGKFKAKLRQVFEDDQSIEVVEVTARILRVPVTADGQQEKYCVEFTKSGDTDSLKFFDRFTNIKEYFGEFVNATYTSAVTCGTAVAMEVVGEEITV